MIARRKRVGEFFKLGLHSLGRLECIGARRKANGEAPGRMPEISGRKCIGLGTELDSCHVFKINRAAVRVRLDDDLFEFLRTL